jgi:hypothetical protein
MKLAAAFLLALVAACADTPTTFDTTSTGTDLASVDDVMTTALAATSSWPDIDLFGKP